MKIISIIVIFFLLNINRTTSDNNSQEKHDLKDSIEFIQQKWKNDSFGCNGNRNKYYLSLRNHTLYNDLEKDSVVSFFGAPNEINIKRDTVYTYYIFSKCNQGVIDTSYINAHFDVVFPKNSKYILVRVTFYD